MQKNIFCQYGKKLYFCTRKPLRIGLPGKLHFSPYSDLVKLDTSL